MENNILILNEKLLDSFAEKIANKILGEKQNQKTDSEELLDVTQASQLIKLTKPTLYGLVHKRKIPYCKKGKKLYFYKNELLDWIKSGRKSSKCNIEERASNYLLKNNLF